MNHHNTYHDPDLPEGAGDVLAAIAKQEEWKVPEQYFDMLEHRIMAHVDADHSVATPEFFEQQSREIRLKSVHNNDEWNVPAGYFEQLPKRIAQRKAKTKVVHLSNTWARVTAVLAVAASVVWAVLFFTKEQVSEPTFSELIAQENVDENDLEYIIEGDELYEFSIDVDLQMVNDSIVPDSTKKRNGTTIQEQLPKAKQHPNNKPDPNAKSKSNSNKGEKNTKPKVNWDELQNDDILYYLNSEGYPDDDI